MSYDPERRAAQPSRAARRTGYRTDPGAKSQARMLQLSPGRRREIARMGGFARAAKLYGYRDAPAAAEARREASYATARQVRAAAASAPQPRRRGRPPKAAGTAAQAKAARAARAAASRPARRAAARAAKRGKP